jgi:aquaporin Z
MTFFFVTVILGVTSPRAPAGFAGIAMGLRLTLIHLVSIPVTNTSVTPARSLGPALFAGAPWIGQLWVFWLAPVTGALVAGWIGRFLLVQSGSESSEFAMVAVVEAVQT